MRAPVLAAKGATSGVCGGHVVAPGLAGGHVRNGSEQAELIFRSPRREGPRGAAEWSAPWKQSFCASGQDRSKTLSCRVLGTALARVVLFSFASRDQQRRHWYWPWRSRSPLPSFRQIRRQKDIASAPARSPPVDPQVLPAFESGNCGTAPHTSPGEKRRRAPKCRCGLAAGAALVWRGRAARNRGGDAQ